MEQSGREYAKAKKVSAKTGAPVEWLLGIANKTPPPATPPPNEDDEGGASPAPAKANGFSHRRFQLTH
jgi:hypothetical protein